MLALDLLRVLCLVLGSLVLRQRARTSPGEGQVWQSHAAGVGVLAVGAGVHLVLGLTGVPGRWAALAFTLCVLPACLLVYRGFAIHHRLHSVTGELADWLVALSCMLAVTAVLDLALQTDLLASPLSGIALQHRVLTFAAVAVLLTTLLRVTHAAGVLFTRTALVLTTSLTAVLAVQVWVVLVDLSPAERVVASFARVLFAGALAWAGYRADDLPRTIVTSPLSTTTTAFSVLLACVAVITATTLQPGDGRLRWSVVWALLAILGLTGRISRLVRGLVHHDRSRREAATDALTGLANRRAFTAALDEATRTLRPLTILALDLNRFKEVNDRYGHATGDRLLQHVGRTLRAALPPGALLARLGGDEFAVLLGSGPEAGDAERSAELARGLSDTAARHPLDGIHRVVVSIGVTTTDGLQDLGGEELLRRADVAMYVAKAAGGGVSTHDETAARRMRRRDRLTVDLRAALSSTDGDGTADRLEVHYQAQLCAAGRTEALEALLRWHHPTLGRVDPSEFLDIATGERLQHELTRHVLARVSADLAGWLAEGHDVRVSVNVAAAQLTDPRLLDLLDTVVAAGTDPARLVVEVTERALAADPDGSARACREIDARGLGLSIDDFGTGWSSLRHLATLPVDEVKIDGEFTSRVRRDPGVTAVVAGTVQLAHHLGLRVVAEGVEDEATRTALLDLGCDLTQGFVHAVPVPAEEVVIARTVFPAPR